VSVLNLHSQLETSNRFPEIVTILQGGELECPDQPRPLAAVHRPRPGRAAPRLAAGPGSTGRSAYGIVTDLTAAGYVAKQKDGRRNRYQIQAHLPLPEPASQEPAIGGVLALLAGAGARLQLTGTGPA
jgi:hypothetical protein